MFDSHSFSQLRQLRNMPAVLYSAALSTKQLGVFSKKPQTMSESTHKDPNSWINHCMSWCVGNFSACWQGTQRGKLHSSVSTHKFLSHQSKLWVCDLISFDSIIVDSCRTIIFELCKIVPSEHVLLTNSIIWQSPTLLHMCHVSNSSRPTGPVGYVWQLVHSVCQHSWVKTILEQHLLTLTTNKQNASLHTLVL